MPEFTTTRSIAAPIERVWQAWTDPAQLAAWFWPERFDTTCEVDLRVGGRYSVRSAVAGMGIAGEYRVVEPPTRLVMTFVWDDDETGSLVTVTLREHEGRTELTLVHEQVDDAAALEAYAEGWESCLDRLVALPSATG